MPLININFVSNIISDCKTFYGILGRLRIAFPEIKSWPWTPLFLMRNLKNTNASHVWSVGKRNLRSEVTDANLRQENFFSINSAAIYVLVCETFHIKKIYFILFFLE